MFTKALLAAAAATTAVVALPSAANAQGYYGYGTPYYGGYNQAYGQRYYGQRYANSYGNRYYGRTYRGYRNQRCGNGTTGAIIGGVAGALLGREVTRGSRSYYGYRRGNSGTTGAIIGGAVGALAGREIARGRC